MNCPPKVKKMAERADMKLRKFNPSAITGVSTSGPLPSMTSPAITKAITTTMEMLMMTTMSRRT